MVLLNAEACSKVPISQELKKKQVKEALERIKKQMGQWNINVNDISSEFTEGKGRPKWILSAYGPGKAPPGSLFEDSEFSPEEVRARFYQLASIGKQEEADQEAVQLWQKADAAINDTLNNIDKVPKLMIQAFESKLNRYELCKMDGTKTRAEFEQSYSTPFGKPAALTFGQPSSSSSPFGSGASAQPAFGQSGFGGGQQTTSVFGQPSTSGFGKPSTPAFGQGMLAKPAFGSVGFGQPTFGATGFGQGENKNSFAPASASGGFGQRATAFGQPPQPTAAFAQPSQPAAFGQSSQPSAFGQLPQPSAFGQSSQPSAFGQSTQPSAFGQVSQPSAFGQTSQTTSIFGQTSDTSSGPTKPDQPFQYSNPFAKAPQINSALGQPPTSSGFGQPAFGSGMFNQGNAANNPFGPKTASPTINDQAMDAASPTAQPSSSRDNQFGTATAAPSGFGAAQSSITDHAGSISTETRPPPANDSTKAHTLTNAPPTPLMYTQSLPPGPTSKGPSGRLVTYRGMQVTYAKDPAGGGEYPCYQRPDGKGLERIWFPDGGNEEQVMALNRPGKKKDFEAEDEAYTDEVKAQYSYLREHGKFEPGKFPMVPPMREWVDYNF